MQSIAILKWSIENNCDKLGRAIINSWPKNETIIQTDQQIRIRTDSVLRINKTIQDLERCNKQVNILNREQMLPTSTDQRRPENHDQTPSKVNDTVWKTERT